MKTQDPRTPYNYDRQASVIAGLEGLDNPALTLSLYLSKNQKLQTTKMAVFEALAKKIEKGQALQDDPFAFLITKASQAYVVEHYGTAGTGSLHHKLFPRNAVQVLERELTLGFTEWFDKMARPRACSVQNRYLVKETSDGLSLVLIDESRIPPSWQKKVDQAEADSMVRSGQASYAESSKERCNANPQDWDRLMNRDD